MESPFDPMCVRVHKSRGHVAIKVGPDALSTAVPSDVITVFVR
jgi:hypothetical protein